MQTSAKRMIYIALAVVLGILLSFIVHGLIEMWYINALTTDFDKYSFGFSWDTWFLIHRIYAIVLLGLGIIFGFFQGRYWWHIVYEQKRMDPFFQKLHRLFGLK